MKHLLAILSIMLIVPMTVQAQTRKRAVGSSAARQTAAKPQQTATPKTSGKFARYELADGKRIISFCQNKDRIIYVEASTNSGGNAVREINKKTGAVKKILGDRQKLYEGESRPFVSEVEILGDSLLLIRTPKTLYYTKHYNLQNPEKWNRMGGGFGANSQNDNGMSHAFLVSPDGNKYAVVTTREKEDGGYRYTINVYDFDKDVKLYSVSGNFDYKNACFNERFDFLNDKGELYALTFNFTCDATGKIFNRKPEQWMDLIIQDLKRNNLKTDGVGMGSIYSPAEMGPKMTAVPQADGSLLISCKRRVYRIESPSANSISTYMKVPPTQDATFGYMATNNKGDVLSCSDSKWTFCKKEDASFDIYGQTIDSDIRTSNKWTQDCYKLWPLSDITMSYIFLRDDMHNNFISSYDGSFLFIYNPYGIEGYEQAKGKCIVIQD